MTDSQPPAERGPRFRSWPRPQSDPSAPRIDLTDQILGDLRQLAHDCGLVAARGREHFLGPDGSVERHAADGIVMNVQELCDRLPAAFRAAHPEVPWDQVRGMRNRAGHDYRATDYRIVWNVLEHGIPDLVRQVNAAPTQ